MGAHSYHRVGTGRTAEEAFEALRTQDLHEYGHSGYSGDIGQAHGFSFATRTPVTPKQADKMVADWYTWMDGIPAKKGDFVKVHTWVKYNARDAKRHKAQGRWIEFDGIVQRKQGDRLRVEVKRPYWDRDSMPVFHLVPQHDCEVIGADVPNWYHQAYEKWGTPVCIPLRGGTVRNRKFLFIGTAGE